jgi:predicted AAA+ superfamily ATPase
MAHYRKRHFDHIFKKTINFSPIVGVIGHRQVGKTTFVSDEKGKYITLDDSQNKILANKDPEDFLRKNSASTLIIDECQKAPRLFEALKGWVRTKKKPGQFLLTGSVRFTSKTSIRESLTGRIVNLELLPLTISEILERQLSDLSSKIISSSSIGSVVDFLKKNNSNYINNSNAINRYLNEGGLPGVCFTLDQSLKDLRLKEYLSTILDRDLREIYATNLPFGQILDFITVLAKSQGLPVDYTEIQLETQISPPTQKKILNALEAVFLIRTLKIEGGRKGFIVFLEDQAESKYLAGKSLSEYQYRIQALYRNVRTEFYYGLGKKFRFFHYLTKHHTSIPFAVETDDGVLGYLPIEHDVPSHAERMAAQSFLKNYSHGKVVMIHPKAILKEVSANTLLMSDRYFY